MLGPAPDKTSSALSLKPRINRSTSLPERIWRVTMGVLPSINGLMIGTLFFAFSLTPSLLPRTFVTQGILSGTCAALGYGIGVGGERLWRYLQLPLPHIRYHRWLKLAGAAICLVVALTSLSRAVYWQNSIRELMGLLPVSNIHPLAVGLIALATFAILVTAARLFNRSLEAMSSRAARFMPRPVAQMLGLLCTVALFWAVLSGILFRAALHVADSAYKQYDALVLPEIPRPTNAVKTGSASSLLDWEDLGRTGRNFVSSGPSAQELSAFLRKEAMEPIRVYAGLRSADTAQERARLALRELARAGGFERSVLIVIVPTGTGWIDPAAIDPVEYLHAGDVASVAIQYSYLASPLSLLVEPDYASEAARALFREVYTHWTHLPESKRPKLYLHGLSLGALSSERSAELFEIIGDPINGAVWSGTPFRSEIWRSVTARRNPGSPYWLPRFRDGSFIRFKGQANDLAVPSASWGPVRIVYLQYASDPVTFFDVHSFYRKPDWMLDPRGPDVSPDFRWYPVVTFLQLLVDMALSTTTPAGYGHVYHPAHYIDAWMEVTGVHGWTADEVARLKGVFESRLSAAA